MIQDCNYFYFFILYWNYIDIFLYIEKTDKIDDKLLTLTCHYLLTDFLEFYFYNSIIYINMSFVIY